MSWKRALDEALDARPEAGPVHVDAGDRGTAEVDMVSAGPIGVRVRGLTLPRRTGESAVDTCHRIARSTRNLPERLTVVEADTRLDGGVLRSDPSDQFDPQEFTEVRVDPDAVRVRRLRADAQTGERRRASWDATREQLARLLGEIQGR